MFDNRTIVNNISFSGVGLHTGKLANVIIKNAASNNGIKFIRKDCNNSIIDASYANVTKTNYGTTITNKEGISVSTIEHIMSALWCMKISNAIIEIDAQEMPIMDGSAHNFIFLLESSGIKKQDGKKNIRYINRAIEILDTNQRFIKAKPSNELIINFTYNAEKYVFNASKDSFINDISLARTFCNIQDIEKIKSTGIANGGGLHNACVFDENKPINQDGARYINERVRHKILDFLGDISLTDEYICGEFSCYNSGHEMNNKLMYEIFSSSE